MPSRLLSSRRRYSSEPSLGTGSSRAKRNEPSYSDSEKAASASGGAALAGEGGDASAPSAAAAAASKDSSSPARRASRDVTADTAADAAAIAVDATPWPPCIYSASEVDVLSRVVPVSMRYRAVFCQPVWLRR